MIATCLDCCNIDRLIHASIILLLTYRLFVTRVYIDAGCVVISWNVEVFGYMGVDARWLRSGIALKAHVLGKMPVNGEIIVDPVDSKIIVKIEPPTEVATNNVI